jgi:hypothetical protein
MKRILLALSAVAALMAGSAGAASALEFGVGPNGVGVDVGPRYHRHFYDYDGGCRVVISHHINRWGNDVTVRRRICD